VLVVRVDVCSEHVFAPMVPADEKSESAEAPLEENLVQNYSYTPVGEHWEHVVLEDHLAAVARAMG
jgi:hypothetical protein